MIHRPPISVCMAAYNGEPFIKEQIASILDQLAADDELVVVDDASADRTIENIHAFSDGRLKLIRNKENEGVICSFEKAVLAARGSIIFLSDMDDRWAPNKVERFLQAFDSSPDTALVISSMRLIDDEGKVLPSQAPLRRRFSPSFIANLIQNTYQGSNMAFRRSLLPELVPFPKGKHFLHDAWIGTRASFVHARIVYIDEPLLDYRVHASNFSGKLGFFQKIQLRLQLIAAHGKRFMQRRPVKIADERGEATR